MEILKKSEDLTVMDIYKMFKSNEIQKVSDNDGKVLPVKAYMIYTDNDSKGEEKTICSIMTQDGEVYATNSDSFMRDFDVMLFLTESMGHSIESIKIVSGKSKAGRTYYTCELESVK